MTLNQWLELDGQILRIVTNKHDYLVAVDDIMNTGRQIVEAGLKEGVDFKTESLENIGYNLFYIGKNADLYSCPGDEAKVLLVRSDIS